jgi:hypothetical protein
MMAKRRSFVWDQAAGAAVRNSTRASVVNFIGSSSISKIEALVSGANGVFFYDELPLKMRSEDL